MAFFFCFLFPPLEAMAVVCVCVYICVCVCVCVRAAWLYVGLRDKQLAPFTKMSRIHGDSCLQQIPFLGVF